MDEIKIPDTYKVPTEPRGHIIKAIYTLAQVVQENNGTMIKISESLKDIAIMKAEKMCVAEKEFDNFNTVTKNVIEKLLK